MKNQKGFIPVIIIILVLAGIIGIYYFITFKSKSLVDVTSHAPSEKDLNLKSKKYVDDIYKFEISLPSEWIYKESYGFINKKVIPGDSVSANSPDDLRMEILISTDNKNNLDEVSNEKSAMTGESPEKVQYQVINGYKFANTIWKNNNTSKVFVVLNGNKWMYSIRFYSKENINIHSESINQILSTFKFIE